MKYAVEENKNKEVEQVEEGEDETDLENKKRGKVQPKKALGKKVSADKSAPKKRQKTKSKKGTAPCIDDDAMVVNIGLVAEVIEDTRSIQLAYPELGHPLPSPGNLSRYFCKNVPLIVPSTAQIHRCQGCKQCISSEDKRHPSTMVFRRICTSEMFLILENRLLRKTYNMHLHLNFEYLRENDATVDVQDITINDEIFAKLDCPQMEVLMEKGFLPNTAAKKSY